MARPSSIRISPRTRLRSRFAATITAFVVGAALLSACSSSEDTTAPAAAASSGSAFPVTIKHKFGSTAIPSKPKRVVTVGWDDQDFALALGVVPVSTREWFTQYPTYPWVKKELGGTKLPTFSAELNFEAIAKQRPDVILAINETVTKESYQKLSAIAPTVVQSSAYADEKTPWNVQTLTTGQALGKSAEAQALVDKVEAKIAAAKKAHPEFAGKVLAMDYGPDKGQHWIAPAHDPRRVLFDELGFATQTVKEDLSEERLDLIDKDVLVVVGATKPAMLASPVFARLNVVKSDRTLYTSFDTPLAGALSYSGPNALLYALDVLVPQLANAVDGKADTKVADLSNQS